MNFLSITLLRYSEKEEKVMTIRGLQIGQKARIESLSAEGELGRRIRDMGLMPGIELQLVGRAPLRDPVALRLNGFTLTLRNNEADMINVVSL
jgi:ferrous iron transport protein A